MGPVAGGVLTTQLGWQWVFLVNLPICAVAVVVGARLLRESCDLDASRRPDLIGAALAIGSVGTLTLAIVQGEQWGWRSTTELVVLLLAAVLGVGFVVRCRTSHDPVLDLTLLRLRFVSSGNTANVLWSMAFYSSYFTNVGWLQDVWGDSAQRSGLMYLPGPVAATLSSIYLSRRLLRRGAASDGGDGARWHWRRCWLFAIVVGRRPSRYWSLFFPSRDLTVRRSDR